MRVIYKYKGAQMDLKSSIGDGSKWYCVDVEKRSAQDNIVVRWMKIEIKKQKTSNFDIWDINLYWVSTERVILLIL